MAHGISASTPTPTPETGSPDLGYHWIWTYGHLFQALIFAATTLGLILLGFLWWGVASLEAARLRLVARIDDMAGDRPNRLNDIREQVVRSTASALEQAEMTRLGLEEMVAWAAHDGAEDELPTEGDGEIVEVLHRAIAN